MPTNERCLETRSKHTSSLDPPTRLFLLLSVSIPPYNALDKEHAPRYPLHRLLPLLLWVLRDASTSSRRRPRVPPRQDRSADGSRYPHLDHSPRSATFVSSDSRYQSGRESQGSRQPEEEPYSLFVLPLRIPRSQY